MRSLTKTFLFFCALSLILLLGFLLGTNYQIDRNGQGMISLNLNPNNKVNQILNLIRHSYVDSVNVDSMEDMAINDILKNLDPHSLYLPPQKAKEQNEALEGNFEGIGIEYYLLSDTLLVTYVNPSGPADKAGLLKGDRIIAVNGIALNAKGLKAQETLNKLKGRKGSKVAVSVLREGRPDPLKFDIIRDKISISSIDAAYMIDSESAYIKISRFGANTDEDFVLELTRLQKQGMKNLILDLRGNGGGYLNSATSLSDQFLGAGKLIVYTKGLHEPRTDYKATESGLFEKGKLVILIDEGTASASEVVAGAVQDLDRGTIIGRRSFGKGLVQEQFGFEDGSAMNLTVARYYTPSGRSIQKPYQKGVKAYKEELNNRYLHGDLVSLDSAKTDTTFAKATQFKTSKGRSVYGGGGIMPDHFVPLDTSYYTSLYRKVNELSLVRNFVYRNLQLLRPDSSELSSRNFKQNYELNAAAMKAFKNFIKSNKVEVKESDWLRSEPKFRQEIKAVLARYYFKDQGFFEVVNQTDSAVNKALELIRKP